MRQRFVSAGWRSLAAMALIATSILACGEGATALPTGLPVSVTQQGFDVPPPIQPFIVAFADTAMVTTVQQAPCAGAEATAGLRDGRLVIALTLSMASPQMCAAARPFTMYTLKVSRVPAGTFPAEFDLRTIAGNSTATSTLISGTVTLP